MHEAGSEGIIQREELNSFEHCLRKHRIISSIYYALKLWNEVDGQIRENCS